MKRKPQKQVNNMWYAKIGFTRDYEYNYYTLDLFESIKMIEFVKKHIFKCSHDRRRLWCGIVYACVYDENDNPIWRACYNINTNIWFENFERK